MQIYVDRSKNILIQCFNQSIRFMTCFVTYCNVSYSELEDQQVALPTYSLFWRQTLSFVLTKAFSHMSLSHCSLGPLFLC